MDGTTNEPLRDASVHLDPASAPPTGLSGSSYQLFGTGETSHVSEYTANSLNDGSFCFGVLKQGTYVLTASKQMFLDGASGANAFLRSGSPLVIADKEITGVSVKLFRLSGISGRITDTDGQPIPDANVVAMKQTWVRGRKVIMPVQGTQSNERGEYRIGKLTPGIYFLYAQSVPNEPAQMFSSEGAASIKQQPSESKVAEIVRTYVSAL